MSEYTERNQNMTDKPAGKKHKASFNDSAFQIKYKIQKQTTKAEQMSGLKYKPN